MHSTELYSNTRHLPFRDLLHLRDMSTSSKSPWAENEVFSNKAGGTNTEDTGPSSHDIAGVSHLHTATRVASGGYHISVGIGSDKILQHVA